MDTKFMLRDLPSNKELIAIWQISGKLTLQFAEAMPEDDYLFRPAGL